MALPARIVIATHNRKKAGEMLTILSAKFPVVEWLTLADFEGAPEPEETGTTYEENARIKADAACAFTGEWCIADDAGLEIDFFDGAPGVYSKRFGGEDLPFPEKIALILSRMGNTTDRGARFRCYVALARPGMPTEVFFAIREGEIAREPSGAGGFGYDPIFVIPELGCTFADISAEEKHRISHRGRVLASVGAFLNTA